MIQVPYLINNHHCNCIPPLDRRTRSYYNGSYRNFTCSRRGTSLLSTLKLFRKWIMISFVSISATYFPMQLLGPAEKGMKL